MQNETNVPHSESEVLNGAAPLDYLGIIKIEGEDAAKFIHGQLTHDFSLLGLEQARLAALCSPKGRMLASFIGYKDAQGNIFLICHKDLIATTMKRLSMFVLRAKARLSDVTASFKLYGLAGDAIFPASAEASTPWSKMHPSDAVVINLYPVLGVPRQLWIGSLSATPPNGTGLSQNIWLWSEVRSGVATICSAVADMLVPQMLNYESVGGINFKKGCYPGQEVVARSQFRGTIKRRAFVVHSAAELKIGDLVYGATDAEQECATVVQAAAAPGGGFDAIISGQLAAIEQGQLHLASANGADVTLLNLGYKLLEDI